MKRRTANSDLVIGMTLAEIFLLLLIVGWYGSRLESEESDLEPGQTYEEVAKELAKTKQQLEIASEQIKNQQRKIDQMQRVLDWIAKTIHYGGALDSIETADKALKTFVEETRRGKASCQAGNILVDVIADDGRLDATVLESFQFVDRSYQKGQRLDASAASLLLVDVLGYYAERRKTETRECAFDYSLAWRTDTDYRSARQKFEQVFYPARIRSLN